MYGSWTNGMRILSFVNDKTVPGGILCVVEDQTGKKAVAHPASCPALLSQYLSTEFNKNPQLMKTCTTQTDIITQKKTWPIFDLLNRGTTNQFKELPETRTISDPFDNGHVPHKILNINKAKQEATCLFAGLGSDPITVSLDRLIEKCPQLVINFCS